MIYKEKFKIGLKDVWAKDEVSNIAILEYLEDIAAYHSDSVGIGVNTTEETHVNWLLLDWELEVLKRPKYGQVLEIHTWSRGIEKFYAFRDFEVLDEQGNVIAKAMSKWVLINIQTEKLERVTDEILFKYNPELDKFAFGPDEDFEKLKEQENYAREVKYSVKRSDIDVNNHMHNINYLDLANEALPDDIYFNSKEFDFFQISYKKEIKLGENVRCKYLYENGKHMIAIKSEDNSKLHAIIELR